MLPKSRNARGALFMSLSMAGFGLNDGMMKLASAEFTVYQAVFLRGLIASLVIGVLAWQQGAFAYRTSRRDRRLIALRTAAEAGSTVLFLTALFNMPIANATAILQSLPLAVTLAAALFLGERVGWRRYSAIAVGLVGVMLIIQPGTDGFTRYSLFALAAVATIVVRDLSTRMLPPPVPALLVTAVSAVAITLGAGLVAAFQPWAPVSGGGMAILATAAGFLLIGYFFGVVAMREGDIGYVSPFRYTILLWAVAIGVVLFGEVPNALTMAGAMIVIASGIYMVVRERRLARAHGH